LKFLDKQGGWYKPFFFRLADQEFATLEACLRFLENDSFHWNFAKNPRASGKKVVYTLSCRDESPMCEGLHKPDALDRLSEKKVSDGRTAACCWQARIMVSLEVASEGQARLYLPDYGENDVYQQLKAASSHSEHLLDGIPFLSLQDRGLFVSSNGHIVSMNAKDRAIPPFLRQKVAELYDQSPSRDSVLSNLVADENLKYFQPLFHSAIDKHKQSLQPKTKLLAPNNFNERLGRLQQRVGGFYHNEFPKEGNPHQAMVVSRLFDDRVVCLIGTPYSFYVLANSSFLYSDGTFNVIKNSNTRLLGMMTHDACGTSYTLALMDAPGETKRSYEEMITLAEEAVRLVCGRQKRVVRHTFDGLNVSSALNAWGCSVPVARVTCYFHVLHNLDGKLKGRHNVVEAIRYAIMLFISRIANASSALAVKAQSLLLQPVLKELFTTEGVVDEKLLRVLEDLNTSILCRRNENFGFFASFCPSRMEAMGPVANRTTACCESKWRSLKQSFQAGQAENSCDLDRASYEHINAQNLSTNFKFHWDVIADVGQKAMNYKLAAMVLSELVRLRHAEAKVSEPQVGHPTARFFLFKKTGFVEVLSEADVRAVVYELIDERGAHVNMTDDEFNVAVARIVANGGTVMRYDREGFLVQFPQSALPGSPDSYSLADCNCARFRKCGLCGHVLCLHYKYMLYRAHRSETVRTDEWNLWPTRDKYREATGLQLGGTALHPATEEDGDEDLLDPELETGINEGTPFVDAEFAAGGGIVIPMVDSAEREEARRSEAASLHSCVEELLGKEKVKKPKTAQKPGSVAAEKASIQRETLKKFRDLLLNHSFTNSQ